MCKQITRSSQEAAPEAVFLILEMASARVVFVLACLVAFVMSAAASKANYADVRSHVSHAFEERAHEMSAALGVLQEVSKATLAGIKALEAKCGTIG